MLENGNPAAPRISVVVPVFNPVDPIQRALESVFAQTIDDYEIIVVDDGSTDGSGDVVQRLGLHQTRLIRSPRNQGAAAARNVGISAASGRGIVFLDSDDFWQPNKLARQLAALEGAPAEFMACATDFYLWQGTEEGGRDQPPARTIQDRDPLWLRDLTRLNASGRP